MATLEDRLLGEKLHNYCSSSSEDESEEEEDKKANKSSKGGSLSLAPPAPPPPPTEPYNGVSTNTGPKGVLKDWQRFKQLETENRKEQEKERLTLAKKLAMSCKSHNDEENDKKSEKDDDVLMDEAILQQYIIKRLEEMHSSVNKMKSFGVLLNLSSADEFLECVDSEDKSVTVVIHLYEDNVAGCEAMNGCLGVLAEERPDVKFCRLKSTSANVSRRFQGSGLPALLVYKSGQMIGNFVRLVDEFGDDFYATDVESFLIEHGVLEDKSLAPRMIRNSNIKARGSDSSDED